LRACNLCDKLTKPSESSIHAIYALFPSCSAPSGSRIKKRKFDAFDELAVPDKQKKKKATIKG
jgi:hypothetical protein